MKTENVFELVEREILKFLQCPGLSNESDCDSSCPYYDLCRFLREGGKVEIHVLVNTTGGANPYPVVEVYDCETKGLLFWIVPGSNILDFNLIRRDGKLWRPIYFTKDKLCYHVYEVDENGNWRGPEIKCV